MGGIHVDEAFLRHISQFDKLLWYVDTNTPIVLQMQNYKSQTIQKWRAIFTVCDGLLLLLSLVGNL